MELRTLGRTGLRVSVLGFGCGNVGGLLIRGTPRERERAVARALELGINYFDTAAAYGDGQSERHLGEALRALRATPHVGTKFALVPGDRRDIGAAVARSLEASLGRLGMERVDLLQLHNDVGAMPGGVTAMEALDAVAPALEALARQGKVRFWGLTAKGDTDALHAVVGAGRYHAVQVFCNLLNPSAAVAVPAGFPAQDFRGLLSRAASAGVGAIVVRVLAGGALSGAATRHPIAAPSVDPIGSGPDYAADVDRARVLSALVREGHAASLVEASLRLPLGTAAVSTVLLGYSSLDQLEQAAAAMSKGPLSADAMTRLAALWGELAAGAR